MIDRRSVCSTLLGAATASLLFAIPASAQERADTLPVFALDPVVVRGFGMPARVSEIPFSVTVVSPATAIPGVTLGEALLAIPGVQVEPRFNFAVGERLSVRGFGSRSQFGVRGARVLVDGLPATFADGQTILDVIDPGRLRRVEAVRGPAAAFHGNAAGGVLAFETERPEEAVVRLAGGGMGMTRAELGAGVSAGPVALWSGGSWLGYDGFRPHSAANLGRLSGGVDWSAGRDRVSTVAHGSWLDAQNPGAVDAADLASDPFQQVENNVRLGLGKQASQIQLGSTWQRETGAGIVESGAHVAGRRMTNPVPGAIIDLGRTAASFRTHLRSIPPSPVRWRIGIDVDGQWDDRLNHGNVEGRRGALVLDQDERVASAAPSASATVPIGSALVHGSLRYDVVHFRVRDRLLAGEDDRSGSRRMGALSPAAGLTLPLTRGTHLFANLSTSFETPTTTELANRPDLERGFHPDLGPQRTRALETGLLYARGALTTEVVGYRATITDALVPFETDGQRGFYTNAGSVVHQGVELAIGVDRGRWRSRAAGSLLDARFREYTVYDDDYAGNRVPGVARASAEAFVGHEFDWGAPQLTARYRGPVPVDDGNSEVTPRHLLLDLTIRVRTIRLGGSRVAPWVEVRNLTNEAWVAGVVPNAFGRRFYEPGPGRSIYIGASLRLGR